MTPSALLSWAQMSQHRICLHIHTFIKKTMYRGRLMTLASRLYWLSNQYNWIWKYAEAELAWQQHTEMIFHDAWLVINFTFRSPVLTLSIICILSAFQPFVSKSSQPYTCYNPFREWKGVNGQWKNQTKMYRLRENESGVQMSHVPMCSLTASTLVLRPLPLPPSLFHLFTLPQGERTGHIWIVVSLKRNGH